MFTLLLLHSDAAMLRDLSKSLCLDGCRVIAAASGQDALALLSHYRIDLVWAGGAPRDMPMLTLVHRLQEAGGNLPVFLSAGPTPPEDIADTLRGHIASFLTWRCAREDAAGARDDTRDDAGDDENASAPRPHEMNGTASSGCREQRAHAVARWANAIVPLIDAPSDPKTLARWSRCIFVSPGALRNWCRTASISPRRSLVFARLLRAVVLNEHGDRRLENLLDVVDRRTLTGLLEFAGFEGPAQFPSDPEAFLGRQNLIRDADALRELRRSLDERREQRSAVMAMRDAHLPSA